MPPFPKIPDPVRVARLEPPAGAVDVVLDTDTYNEIDDQFAVCYALRSPERLNVRAIYAAPFHNERSDGPADGMRKSYAEILRLLERLGRKPDGFAFEGSTRWLPPAKDAAIDSAAARDLVAKAMARGDDRGPLYVVAIGAITNVASALLMEPRIAERVVVCWLGGHPTAWHTAHEFNLQQDVPAAQVVLDSGVPFVLLPCKNVAEHLRTTQAEIDRYVKGRGRVGDYLAQVYTECHADHFAYSRVIWDLAPLAWLVNPRSVETQLTTTPELTERKTWARNPHRPLMREAIGVNRDAIFRDVFTKVGSG